MNNYVRLLIALFLPLCGGVFFFVTLDGATAVHAASLLTVDTLIDESDGSCADGDCSLRDALVTAVSGDHITFSVGGVIDLSVLGQLTISKDVSIDGGKAITLSGGNATRVLSIESGHVTLNGVTIIEGDVQTFDCGLGIVYSFPPFLRTCGGGIIIQSEGAIVTITNSLFRGNTAILGGALYNHRGVVNLYHTELISNSSRDMGGAIFNITGTVNIYDSTLQENLSNWGGGVINWYGSVQISQSAILSNTARHLWL